MHRLDSHGCFGNHGRPQRDNRVLGAEFMKKFLRRELAAPLSHAFRWQADKLLRVLGRFKRQTHLKPGALRTCFEVDFPAMPFDDDSVGDHESNSGT
jgi:hypothetical protein